MWTNNDVYYYYCRKGIWYKASRLVPSNNITTTDFIQHLQPHRPLSTDHRPSGDTSPPQVAHKEVRVHITIQRHAKPCKSNDSEDIVQLSLSNTRRNL